MVNIKNIEQRHDIMYNRMVAAKAGEELTIPIYCDNEGDKVKNVKDAFDQTKN